jgi:CRISPR-associated endonuclease Csn1
MKDFTLGLDIGANSVGWALIPGNPDEIKGEIPMGVRVFPEGTDKKGAREESRNLARRTARQMRRQLDRRSRRRKKVYYILRDHGILPKDKAEMQSIYKMDPYCLRTKGLDEELSPEEFGRVLLHLSKRRGFKSSRKSQGAAKKEEGVIKKDISALAEEIEQSGARTLGEYLSTIPIPEKRVRGRHTSRQMYEDEFDLLWEKQSGFKPELWTDDLKEKVHYAIFYQRPLKPQDHLIGRCDLEPEEQRCEKASWYAQQARVLQDLNNLRVLTKTEGEQFLTTDQREQLYNALMTTKQLKIDRVKTKILKLTDVEKINFENGRDKLEGNPVEVGLHKIFKKDYEERPEWYRDEVWESLLDLEPEIFVEKAKKEWELAENQIDALYKIERPNGYANRSLKALKKILPYLEEGCNLWDAISNAGYEKKKPEPKGWLPPIRAGKIRNPVVVRSMSETRKVINAIIREYGMPKKIIVEMARETKGSMQQRMDHTNELYRRQQHHEWIRGELDKLGVVPNREAVEKYKLWEECEGKCPYTGRSIGLHQLFGSTSEFEIEHIIPYSVSFDNSFMNKTLCARTENQKKGNRTPWEAYGETPAFEEMQVRVRKMYKMPYRKKNLFALKEVSDDFTERQLRDSSYIATEVVDFLKDNLGVVVKTTRGQITAELRRQWGLNSILSEDEIKTRDDHRHHAVDAVVIALATPTHHKKLSRKYHFKKGEVFPSPWESEGVSREEFRQMVEKSVNEISVSHRPQRKVQGQLNEATNYGPTAKEGYYSYRVRLDALTPKMADRIVDPVVKELVADRLRQHGIEPGKGSSTVKTVVFEQPLYMKANNGRKGPKIEKVRVRKPLSKAVAIKDEDGNPYRYVEPGSNHHVTIFEYEDGEGNIRRCKEIVSRFEAAQRQKRKEPVIRRVHPKYPQAKFLMSLSINDMVLVEDKEGKSHLCRVQKFSGGEREEELDINFRLHIAANIESSKSLIRLRNIKPSSFNVKKVFVDILGRIHPCHD